MCEQQTPHEIISQIEKRFREIKEEFESTNIIVDPVEDFCDSDTGTQIKEVTLEIRPGQGGNGYKLIYRTYGEQPGYFDVMSCTICKDVPVMGPEQQTYFTSHERRGTLDKKRLEQEIAELLRYAGVNN